MSTIVAYLCLKSFSPEDLTIRVNAAIQEGFVPFGSPFIHDHDGKLYQGMTKDDSGIGANQKLVTDGDTVELLSADGQSLLNPNTTVQASVVDGSLSMEVADANAVVADAQALVVPVTGTYTTTATVSVSGNQITGIVLS